MPTFARDQIGTALKKRVEALMKGYRQNVGIIGSSGLGKTDFLSSAYREFSLQPSLICAYVQAESFDFESLVERWTGALLTGYCRSESLPASASDFQGHAGKLEARIPKTVQSISRIRRQLHKEPAASILRDLFALSGVLAQETSKKVILMLDEFQEIGVLPDPDPFAVLGREIMVQTDTLYLVSSSHPERAREIFRDKLSLLFGNFEIMELRPFEFSETVDFISRHFPRTFFSTQQKKLLISLTNGDPLYLDLILDRLKFYLSPETEQYVSDRLLFLAIQEELFDRKGRIALLFERMLDPVLRASKDGGSNLRVLLAVSEGRSRLSEISSCAGRKTAETQKILQRLVHEDRVRKFGTFYVMEDPLFRFWLREVFQKKQRLCVPDEKSVCDELMVSLREKMEVLEHDEKKDVPSRIERLFKEFRNDAVEVETRKLKCPQFLEIAFRPAQGRFCSLAAKGSKDRWVCLVAEQRVSEEDVLSFIEDLKRSRKKIQQKIIFTFEGIDQNAKLMAQAAQVQVWGLRELNSLFGLYDLPKLMMFEDRNFHGSTVGPVAESVYSS